MVTCDQCFDIFNNEKFDWNCPSCGDKYESENEMDNFYDIPENRGRSKSTNHRKVEIYNNIEDNNKKENNL